MNKNRTILTIVLMMGLVFFWQRGYEFIVGKLGYDVSALRKPPAELPIAQPATQASTAPSSTPTISPSTASAPSNGLSAIPATQPSRTTLGSPAAKDENYRIAVNIVAEGAGIDSILLNEFKKSVTGLDPYTFQQPYPNHESDSRPLATRSITIDGRQIDVSALPWNLVSSSQRAVVYSLDVNGPDGPLVRITKSFEVFDKTDVKNGSGFEVLVSQSIQNLTATPHEVSLLYNGPTTPPRELDRGSDRMIIGGYLNGHNVYVLQHYIESFGTKQPTLDYTTAEKQQYPLLWAGTASVYFDAIMRPQPLDPSSATPSYIAKVEARSLNPDVADSTAHAVNVTFQTKPMTLAPSASISMPLRAYFGPKQRKLLTDEYYSVMPRRYDSTLVITSGICGICTFGWLIEALVWLLNKMHFVLRDWGLAIIGLVFLVRLLLHPITKKSQVNMAKMSKFGPEIEKLKEKHKDDPTELNKAMMQFYKEHGMPQLLGCLPMFLQMPIWIALWQALQTTFELRHAGFLRYNWGSLTWIKDLSQPDHLITLAHPISIFGLIPISGLNILPILMGIVFFIQQKYFTPKPPTMTAEQAQQQKIMQWMTGLLFPLMLYAGPSGLNLYILTSTTFGIIESKIIRDHLKQREEAEKAGRVFVDPGKKFGGGGGGGKPRDPTKPKGRIATMLAALQEKAEQMQREQNRKRR